MKLEVADGIREIRLGAYRKTGNKAETEWLVRNRLGTEPYAGWCGRTAGATPPWGMRESTAVKNAFATLKISFV